MLKVISVNKTIIVSVPFHFNLLQIKFHNTLQVEITQAKKKKKILIMIDIIVVFLFLLLPNKLEFSIVLNIKFQK